MSAKQIAYQTKESEVSTAYNLMLGLQKTFQDKAAIFDYETLLEYSMHNEAVLTAEQIATNADPNTADVACGSGIPASAGQPLPCDLQIKAGYIANPLKLAKNRLDTAKQAYTDAEVAVTKLQARNKAEVTKQELADTVAKDRQETEDWALRAIRFSKVERLIKDRIVSLKVSVKPSHLVISQSN